MTLLFPDNGANAARIHALVIGIGAYPHLLNGSKSKTAPAKDSFGLKQLASPPVSARAISDWLVEDLNNPGAELGSVDLLIAEDGAPIRYVNPKKGINKEIEIPDKATLTKAIKAWKKRTDRNSKNVALFYFCGHGVASAGELALLTSDFANPAEDHGLANAIDFGALLKGAEWGEAENQVFFIDACRNEISQLLEQPKLGDDWILPWNKKPPPGATRRQAVYYAAARHQRAHGLPNMPSRFTEALLCGLKGAGGSNPGKGWVVDTITLHASVCATLRLGNRRQKNAVSRMPSGHSRLDRIEPTQRALRCTRGNSK